MSLFRKSPAADLPPAPASGPAIADDAVQHLAEQALGLSANLDDDGIVPLVFFDHRPYPLVDIRLSSYAGVVDHHHQQFGGEETMGSTRYTAAMNAVIDHHRQNAPTTPALVIFQTDGQPGDPSATEDLLRQASRWRQFWAFVGFGASQVPFLQGLDNLRGRAVDNASYFHAGANPMGIADADLYDGLTAEFGAWLSAAHAAGILG